MKVQPRDHNKFTPVDKQRGNHYGHNAAPRRHQQGAAAAALGNGNGFFYATADGEEEDPLVWRPHKPEKRREIRDRVLHLIFQDQRSQVLSPTAEQLANPTSAEEFRGALGGLNSAITGRNEPFGVQSPNKPGAALNDLGVAYVYPNPELQQEYLSKLVDTLPTIENLRDRTTLAHYMISALHLFWDGNGRTARLTRQLMLGEKMDAASIETIGTHNKFESGAKKSGLLELYNFDELLNREVARQMLGEKFISRYGVIGTNSFANKMPFAQKAPIRHKIDTANRLEVIGSEVGGRSFPVNGVIFARLIQLNLLHDKMPRFVVEDPDLEEALMDKVRDEDKGKELYIIQSSYGLDHQLDVNHVQQIYDLHDEFKRRYLDTMIDVFVNPNQYVAAHSGKTYADIVHEPDDQQYASNLGRVIDPSVRL